MRIIAYRFLIILTVLFVAACDDANSTTQTGENPTSSDTIISMTKRTEADIERAIEEETDGQTVENGRFLDIVEVTSDNGLTAWLVEDHSLPIILCGSRSLVQAL